MLQFSERTATAGAALAHQVRNKVLQSLTSDEFELLRSHLRPVMFRKRASIHEEHAPALAVSFVERGLISRTVQTRADAPLEVAMDGSSGIVGLSIVLGSTLAMHRTVAIVPTSALQIDRAILQQIMEARPSIRNALLRYTHSLGVQMAQVSLCNTRHMVESRVPRWLLMAHDRLGEDTIPVTQEVIAMLLGVRRPGVSAVLQKLEDDGVLQKARGSIRIRDRARLLERSCGCCRLIEERSATLKAHLHQHVFASD